MTFKDIKGQEKTIELLKGCLQASFLTGTYLFTGEEGIGKHLVAQTLAKALNCLNKKDDACDNCPSCLKVEKREHPDVHFIEPLDSDAIKIEATRDLKKKISLKAYEAKTKVFIINDAHKLTAEAANALLKILEEPLGNSLIMLISAKPALLFKTIISRCKIVRFYPLKKKQLQEVLENNYSLDDASAHFLAYFCEGRIGAALQLKEADILKRKNKIIDEFISSTRGGQESILMQNKTAVRLALNILVSWARDIYLIRIGTPHAELINLDRKTELIRVMNRYTLFGLEEMIKTISDSLLYLEQNINMRLLLANLKAELWKG
jgi:DNA polymerase-3 subunit delta'